MSNTERRFTGAFEAYITRLLVEAESDCGIPADGWAEKRVDIMRGLQRTVGGDLPRAWPPLAPRVEGVRPRDGFRVEQVSAQFWPGIRCALQVYVPEGIGPFPGVVMVATGQTGPRHPVYQSLGGGLARMGILTVGTLALGKGASGTDNSPYPYNSIALLAGTSIAQEQFHTGRRALDYLLSRDDVDPQCIGMTGDSDGGWVTLWVATLDERITAAAPACTNYTFCSVLFGQYPWHSMVSAEGNSPEAMAHAANIPMMTACNAPKWFRFLNAEQERSRLHNIPVIDAAAQAAYTHAGVPERYSSHLSDCEHGYWPVMQVEAIEWFCERFFGRRPEPGKVTTGRLLAGTDLAEIVVDGRPVQVFTEDTPEFTMMHVGDLPDDPGKSAFLSIVDMRRRDAAEYRAKLATDAAAEQMLGQLRLCLGIQDLCLRPQGEATRHELDIETESGLTVRAEWVRGAAEPGERVRLVVGAAADRGGYDDCRLPRLDLKMREETGLGEPLWALVLLNRPPLGMWVWDAICAAHWLRRQGWGSIELVGAGEAGAVIAPFAGILSDDVASVSIVSSPVVSLDELVSCHPAECRYWAHRLLWVTDTPEIIQMLSRQGRWKEQ